MVIGKRENYSGPNTIGNKGMYLPKTHQIYYQSRLFPVAEIDEPKSYVSIFSDQNSLDREKRAFDISQDAPGKNNFVGLRFYLFERSKI